MIDVFEELAALVISSKDDTLSRVIHAEAMSKWALRFETLGGVFRRSGFVQAIRVTCLFLFLVLRVAIIISISTIINIKIIILP